MRSNHLGNKIKAVIFDLDGVIVSTDEHHYRAWKKIADEIGVEFSREINDLYFRGSSRRQCIKFLLDKSSIAYDESNLEQYAERKNNYYKLEIMDLSRKDILPGVLDVLDNLERRQIKTAIASSSRNMEFVLNKLKLHSKFNVTVGGNDIKKSKPDPEVFIKAASLLGIDNSECLVIEDAKAGVIAGKDCGMMVMGVGSASELKNVDFGFPNLQYIFESGFFAIQVERWQIFEISLTSAITYKNPYKDVDVTTVFIGPNNETISRPAFWDGGNTWGVRFAPNTIGNWKYTVASNDNNSGFNDIWGEFECIAYAGDKKIKCIR